MAVKGDGLDSFVASLSKNYTNQLAIRNAEDEKNFMGLVIDNNLSLEDQLAYRQEQKKRVQDRTEVSRINAEIKTLKTRIEANNFTNDYLEKLANADNSVSAIDETLNWLNDQYLKVNDPDLKLQIKKSITEKTSERFTIVQNTIVNQTNYALNDKTGSVLDAQISKINALRNDALLAKNDYLVSTYDLSLQALNKAKTENSITKDLTEFAANTITGYSTATRLLDAYNQKISSSDISTPVTIGDVTYTSAKDFWTYKRDSYLADQSSNGFFPRFNTEVNNDLKVKGSKNILTTGDVTSVASQYASLASRPELASYQTTIGTIAQDSLQTGADIVAGKILVSYFANYDVTSAISSLDTLRNLGVNVDDAYSKILAKAAEIKSGQVSNILSSAQTVMQNDPNATPQSAVTQASQSGAGAVLSPEQLVTKNETQIASELATGAQNASFNNNPATTTQPGTQGTPQNVPPVVPQAVVTPSAPIKITSQLQLGSTGAEVKALQQFLNKQGYTVATTGAGSAGNETDYYGPLTQAAVQKFQAAQGIVSSGDPTTTGYGRVGPQTLAKINSLY